MQENIRWWIKRECSKKNMPSSAHCLFDDKRQMQTLTLRWSPLFAINCCRAAAAWECCCLCYCWQWHPLAGTMHHNFTTWRLSFWKLYVVGFVAKERVLGSSWNHPLIKIWYWQIESIEIKGKIRLSRILWEGLLVY